MKIGKRWGFEEVIVNNHQMGYCGKILHLRRGGQSSHHYHKIKHETFYILSGKVRVEGPFPFPKEMLPGDSVAVQPGTAHSFYGIEESMIIEFSTPHREEDVVRLTESSLKRAAQ